MYRCQTRLKSNNDHKSLRKRDDDPKEDDQLVQIVASIVGFVGSILVNAFTINLNIGTAILQVISCILAKRAKDPFGPGTPELDCILNSKNST